MQCLADDQNISLGSFWQKKNHDNNKNKTTLIIKNVFIRTWRCLKEIIEEGRGVASIHWKPMNVWSY